MAGGCICFSINGYTSDANLPEKISEPFAEGIGGSSSVILGGFDDPRTNLSSIRNQERV